MRCCAPAREATEDREPFSIGTPSAEHVGFVDVPTCEFRMGNDGPEANPGDFEGPVRSVRLDAFSIGATVVTNREFNRFVTATGYVTDAEALEGFQLLARREGILPALESAHAIAYTHRLLADLPAGTIVLVNLSGRGDKDVQSVAEALR